MVGPLLPIAPSPAAPRLFIPGVRTDRPREDELKITPDARELARRYLDRARAGRDALLIRETVESARTIFDDDEEETEKAEESEDPEETIPGLAVESPEDRPEPPRYAPPVGPPSEPGARFDILA